MSAGIEKRSTFENAAIERWKMMTNLVLMPHQYEQVMVRLRDMARSFPLHCQTFMTHPAISTLFRSADFGMIQKMAASELEKRGRMKADTPDGWCELIPLDRQREAFSNADPLICVIMAHNNKATSEATYYHLYHLLHRVYDLRLEGDCVELGCYEGKTSAFFQSILTAKASVLRKELHVYDSFEGVPTPDENDGEVCGGLKKGDLAVGQEKFKKNFLRYDLPLPQMHRGFFEDTLPHALPDKICFAYLDGDMYSSIKTSLEGVYPRLVPGGFVVIDDYADPDVLYRFALYPGVKRACDEFFADKPERVKLLPGGGDPNVFDGMFGKAYGSHGFFQKS